MIITEAQYEAYQTKIVDRWEQYQIMPDDYTIVSDNDPRGDTVGVWVASGGGAAIYIGIETDGYTHS